MEETMPGAQLSAALPFVLRWEGGYVNHPNDRGGPTNKGVTQKVYDGYRARHGLAARDVKLLEDVELRDIYEAGYWLPPRCDVLDQEFAQVHFDTAVNMGPGRAVRFLQSAVGCGVDGNIGPKTLQAVQACDAGSAIEAYCNRREQFYRDLVGRDPSQQVFMKGWMNRLNALRKQIGLPGFESARSFDMGDADYIARIPDIGEDPKYDF
jgi:lysozyme family protein